MDDTMNLDANPSGAPTFGGSTSHDSRFGGKSLFASLLRFVARVARDLESTAYRRLRELEERSTDGPHPGAPNRVKQSH